VVKVPDDEYTNITEGLDLSVWVCNNCGAFAETKEQVRHFETCKAGESKRWEQYYGQTS
jgi:rubrerythrin